VSASDHVVRKLLIQPRGWTNLRKNCDVLVVRCGVASARILHRYFSRLFPVSPMQRIHHHNALRQSTRLVTHISSRAWLNTLSCPARTKILPRFPPINPESRMPARIPLYLVFCYRLLLSGPPVSAVLRGTERLAPRSLRLRCSAAGDLRA